MLNIDPAQVKRRSSKTVFNSQTYNGVGFGNFSVGSRGSTAEIAKTIIFEAEVFDI